MRYSHSLRFLALFAFATGVPAQSVARDMSLAARGQATPAHPMSASSGRVTIELEGVPLAQALEAIARQADRKLTMTDAVARMRRPVTLRVRDAQVSEVFRKVLVGT